MTKEPTWQKAIEKVLRESPVPLHYKKIAAKIISDGLYDTSGNKTPPLSVHATINNSIRKEGDKSPFLGFEPGDYGLTSKDYEAEKYKYAIVTSFGMCWRRDVVNWNKRSPEIRGWHVKEKKKLVDFAEQKGVYLLHLGGQVIYVGKTEGKKGGKKEGRLAMRLKEHAKPTTAQGRRLAPRWDRFSWFGLCPVDKDGNLGDPPGNIDADKLLPVIEAILIESLEPRQNRQKGEGLGAVEYFQEPKKG